MNTEKTQKSEKIVDPLTNYKIKHRALLFGALSIIFMVIAIAFYENTFNFLNLPTVLTKDGVIVADSFIGFILFGAISLLFATIGLFYSIIKKKILSVLLSSVVFVGISFIIIKHNIDISKELNSFKIVERVNVVIKKVEPVVKEINSTSIPSPTPMTPRLTEINSTI